MFVVLFLWLYKLLAGGVHWTVSLAACCFVLFYYSVLISHTFSVLAASSSERSGDGTNTPKQTG
jgi:hypothetical protein